MREAPPNSWREGLGLGHGCFIDRRHQLKTFTTLDAAEITVA